MAKNVENGTTNDFADVAPKKNKLLPICIVLLVAICLGLGGFYYYFSTPKKIVTSVLDKAYANYDKMMNEGMDLDLTKDAFKVEGDLKLDTNIEGFESLKEEKIGFALGLDYKDKKFEAGASLTEEKSNILDVMAYLVKDSLYVSLKDDYKNLIKLDDDEYNFDELFNLEDLENATFTKDDISYIVKSYKDILVKSINEDDLKKSSDTLEIDGKDTKVTKIAYKLNEDNYEDFVKNIIDETLDNEKLLDIIAKISGEDKKDIKDELKDAKDDIEVPSDIDLTFNIYTKGFRNEFVGLDLKSDEVTINVVVNKDATEITVNADGFNIIFDVKEYSEDKVDINFTAKAAGEKITGSIVSTNKKDGKNSYKGTFAINVKYNDYKFAVNMNYNITKGAKIADVDTKNAVDEATAAKDLNKVSEKILTRIQKSNLYGIIGGLASLYSSNSSSYLDY